VLTGTTLPQRHANATPLHAAAVNGRLLCMRLLLQHGADVEATKTDGKSALHRAAEEGHLDCVLVLLEHGANRRVRDKARAGCAVRAGAAFFGAA
jgi:ankyrin repeat protein